MQSPKYRLLVASCFGEIANGGMVIHAWEACSTIRPEAIWLRFYPPRAGCKAQSYPEESVLEGLLTTTHKCGR